MGRGVLTDQAVNGPVAGAELDLLQYEYYYILIYY